MAWLHRWAGLLLGWLLYAIFVTGTSAYFQEETTRWMTPEIGAMPADRAGSFEAAADWLEEKAPDASEWTILIGSKRAAGVQLYWVNGPNAPADAPTAARLDGFGKEVAARETQGGYFLYRFHYDLHYINWYWARWLVGVAAMAMLVAILSGIVTHKKIFVDFFTLRLGKGQRSWLDGHTAASVLFLPFVLMITYTGLVSLAAHYMPWGIAANYADEARFYDAAFPYPPPPDPAGVAAPLAPIRPVIAEARTAWSGAQAGGIRVLNPGDRTARIIVSSALDAGLSARPQSMTFDGVTGRPLDAHRTIGAAAETESVMIGLHTGRFAQPVLRWIYFLSGLAGCVMVASGLILWVVKRRGRLADPGRPHFGFRLVEKLNIGAIAGLPIGIATYFLANRLLPLGMAARGEWEIHCMFIVWGGSFVWAAVRTSTSAWTELLMVGATGFAAVPLVSAMATDRNLVTSIARGDFVLAGFEFAMLIIAAGFALAARKSRVRAQQPRNARRQQAGPRPV